MQPHNVYNTTNFLFMLVTVVVYSSTAYIPAIVLERPLYIRCCALFSQGCSTQLELMSCPSSPDMAGGPAAAVRHLNLQVMLTAQPVYATSMATSASPCIGSGTTGCISR